MRVQVSCLACSCWLMTLAHSKFWSLFLWVSRARLCLQSPFHSASHGSASRPWPLVMEVLSRWDRRRLLQPAGRSHRVYRTAGSALQAVRQWLLQLPPSPASSRPVWLLAALSSQVLPLEIRPVSFGIASSAPPAPTVGQTESFHVLSSGLVGALKCAARWANVLLNSCHNMSQTLHMPEDP